MRELNISIAGIHAAATSHLGSAERGPWQLDASDHAGQPGMPPRYSKRS
jgi:hypothetical protein